MRMAVSLLKALFTVGRPRRRRLLSTESSWISVAVWISSTTTAPKIASSVTAPNPFAARRTRVGRNRFP